LISLGGYPCVLRFVFPRFFGLPRFTILVAFGLENLLLICPARGWLLRCRGGLFLCLPGVDHYRKEGGRSPVPLCCAQGLREREGDPALIVAQKLALERAQYALSRLDPSQQEVVVLRFLLGLSLREVALTMDRTVAAVKSLQHRGLKALRGALKQV